MIDLAALAPIAAVLSLWWLFSNFRMVIDFLFRKSPGVKIAFGCQSRVGKDTAADYLIGKHGGVKVSFATPMYKIMHFTQQALGFKQKKDPKFLQNIGTWARNQNSEVWVEWLKTRIDSLEGENIFVSDVRYPTK